MAMAPARAYSKAMEAVLINSSRKQSNKERIMNVLKNMEVIFVFAAALGAATSYATASERAIVMAADVEAVVAEATEVANVPVIVVAAKRLTAAEKAAL